MSSLGLCSCSAGHAQSDESCSAKTYETDVRPLCNAGVPVSILFLRRPFPDERSYRNCAQKCSLSWPGISFWITTFPSLPDMNCPWKHECSNLAVVSIIALEVNTKTLKDNNSTIQLENDILFVNLCAHMSCRNVGALTFVLLTQLMRSSHVQAVFTNHSRFTRHNKPDKTGPILSSHET